MIRVGEILKYVGNLKSHPWQRKPEENERLFGGRNDARFVLSKVETVASRAGRKDGSILVLSIYGPEYAFRDKKQLEKYFVAAFGKPDSGIQIKNPGDSPILLWDASAVLDKKSK